MVLALGDGRTKRGQEFVHLLLLAGYKGPTRTGLELRAPRFEPLRRVRQWIDADRNQVNVFTNCIAHLLLHARKSCRERRTDGRAVSEDEVNGYCFVFDEV